MRDHGCLSRLYGRSRLNHEQGGAQFRVASCAQFLFQTAFERGIKGAHKLEDLDSLWRWHDEFCATVRLIGLSYYVTGFFEFIDELADCSLGDIGTPGDLGSACSLEVDVSKNGTVLWANHIMPGTLQCGYE